MYLIEWQTNWQQTRRMWSAKVPLEVEGALPIAVCLYLPLAGGSLLKPAGKGRRRVVEGCLTFLADSSSPTEDQEPHYICWWSGEKDWKEGSELRHRQWSYLGHPDWPAFPHQISRRQGNNVIHAWMKGSCSEKWSEMTEFLRVFVTTHTVIC